MTVFKLGFMYQLTTSVYSISKFFFLLQKDSLEIHYVRQKFKLSVVRYDCHLRRRLMSMRHRSQRLLANYNENEHLKKQTLLRKLKRIMH